MMRAKQINANGIGTAFMLGLKYQKPYIPLEDVIADYMPHLTASVANRRAAAGSLPFPAFKADGAKSPYLVSVAALAAYLDAQQQLAEQDWMAGQ